MKPTVTSLLKQLSSLLKIGGAGGRATGTPFARWDRSHFERWTQPGASAAPERRQSIRGSLKVRASQVQALYYH